MRHVSLGVLHIRAAEHPEDDGGCEIGDVYKCEMCFFPESQHSIEKSETKEGRIYF